MQLHRFAVTKINLQTYGQPVKLQTTNTTKFNELIHS